MPPPRMRRDLALNALGTVIKVVVIGWLIRLAGQEMSIAAFGAFLLARRVADTGANLLQAGTSFTLLRFLPIHAREPAARRYLMLAALGWAVLAAAVVGAIGVALGPRLGRWVFPEASEATGLAMCTAALVVAGIVTFQALGASLGQRHIARANVIGILAGGGFSLAYLLATGRQDSPLPALWVQAAGSAVVSAMLLAVYLKGVWGAGGAPGKPPIGVRETFVDYGLPRTAVGFMDAGLLLLGPWLIRDQVEVAGYLIAALVLFRVAQAAIQPVAQLAFVVTAELIGEGNSAGISSGVRLIVGAVLHVGALGLAVLVPWSDYLVVLWLGRGPVSTGVQQLYTPLLVGLLPFALFQGLRGIVEAESVRPLNLLSLGAGAGGLIAVFIGLSRVGSPAGAAVVGLDVAFLLAGGLTLVWVRRRLPSLGYLGVAPLLAAALAAFAANWWLAREPGAARLAAGLVVAATSALALAGFGRSRFLQDCRAFATGARASEAREASPR